MVYELFRTFILEKFSIFFFRFKRTKDLRRNFIKSLHFAFNGFLKRTIFHREKERFTFLKRLCCFQLFRYFFLKSFIVGTKQLFIFSEYIFFLDGWCFPFATFPCIYAARIQLRSPNFFFYIIGKLTDQVPWSVSKSFPWYINNFN